MSIRPRNPLTRPLLLIVGAVLFAAAVFAMAACGGGGDKKNDGDSGQHAGLAADQTQPTPQATIDLARPTAASVRNLSEVGKDDRIVIPSIGVSAPMTLRKVGKDGQMPNPAGEDDLALYDFSEWPGLGGGPGLGGNTVLAGHVDSGFAACKNGTVPPPCQAVLWDLNKLKVGEEIQMVIGGKTHKYKVTSNQPVSANNGPWDQIVASTAQETVTIITCGGDFNRETHEYNNRQVVTAVVMA